MKIYTRTGDTGQTSLIGGTRVPKHHLRIETYGTVDELNSFIGMIRDLESTSFQHLLLGEIQDRLFIIGSHLATDPAKSKMQLPDLQPGDVTKLEQAIDAMNKSLPELRNFVLPGGHPAASWCHLARCVCRRCERLISHLSETESLPPAILIYLNRLSDYLFVLARKVLYNQNGTELLWKTRE